MSFVLLSTFLLLKKPQVITPSISHGCTADVRAHRHVRSVHGKVTDARAFAAAHAGGISPPQEFNQEEKLHTQQHVRALTHTCARDTHTSPGHEHQPGTCISAQQWHLANEEWKHCGAACPGRCEGEINNGGVRRRRRYDTFITPLNQHLSAADLFLHLFIRQSSPAGTALFPLNPTPLLPSSASPRLRLSFHTPSPYRLAFPPQKRSW